mgnify:CR=1 FL=1
MRGLGGSERVPCLAMKYVIATCGHCQESWRFPATAAGTVFACPKCRNTVEVPAYVGWRPYEAEPYVLSIIGDLLGMMCVYFAARFFLSQGGEAPINESGTIFMLILCGTLSVGLGGLGLWLARTMGSRRIASHLAGGSVLLGLGALAVAATLLIESLWAAIPN